MTDISYNEIEDLAASLFPGPSTEGEAHAFVRLVVMLAVAVANGRLPVDNMDLTPAIVSAIIERSLK